MWHWARGTFQHFGGFPIIFLQRLGLATSNLAHSWGLPRPIVKSHKEERQGWPWAREVPQTWGSPSIFTKWLKQATSNLGHSLSLPRPTIKPHPEEKWAWPWVKLPYIRGSPLIFLQLPRCPLSVSGASCFTLISIIPKDYAVKTSCDQIKWKQILQLCAN